MVLNSGKANPKTKGSFEKNMTTNQDYFESIGQSFINNDSLPYLTRNHAPPTKLNH